MQIQNQFAIDSIRNSASLTLAEGYPQNLLPNVQPVMDMTPRNHRVSTIVRGSDAAGNVTLLTTPTDRDFFLTGATLTRCKTATDPNTSDYLNAIIGGVRQNILVIVGVTLTADSQTVSINLQVPIKIDRGTTIVCSASNTTTRLGGSIIGYTVDNF